MGDVYEGIEDDDDDANGDRWANGDSPVPPFWRARSSSRRISDSDMLLIDF